MRKFVDAHLQNDANEHDVATSVNLQTKNLNSNLNSTKNDNPLGNKRMMNPIIIIRTPILKYPITLENISLTIKKN